MLMRHVEPSLALRRAAGLARAPIAGSWRSLARFATQRGATRVVATTALAGAPRTPTDPPRHDRLQPRAISCRLPV